MPSFKVNHQTDYVGGRIEQRRCNLTHKLELLDETHPHKNFDAFNLVQNKQTRKVQRNVIPLYFLCYTNGITFRCTFCTSYASINRR